jgi:hypothetical protein
MPGREAIGWTEGSLVGPGAERLMDIRGGSPEEPRSLVLLPRGSPRPLLRVPLVPDPPWPSGGGGTAATAASVVWGNGDGTLTACDLPAVRRRLAGLGLRW